LANIKSSEKDINRSRARRQRNFAVRSTVRTYIRRYKEAVATEDEAQIRTAYKEAQSVIDRAVNKGVLKANTGARYKSRLAALSQLA
jgi:small subunit ribosomal protein S20